MRADEFIFEHAVQDYSEYSKEVNGLDMSVQLNHRTGNLTVMAYDDGQLLGQVLFKLHGGTKLYPWQLEVEPQFRGKGVAKTMYDFIKGEGFTIHRSTYQTDAGSGFWDKHRGRSATVWEDSESRDASFKQWFGNSKVVDAHGKPLVVYHGTDKDFSQFESASGVYYFTPDADYASTGSHSSRGDRHLMPVYLSIQNPAVIDSREQLTDKTVNRLRQKGYDGAIGKINNYVFEYIAFYPTQIKSAIGNIGKFDSNNADITAESL